jgi:hypothetical protein
LTDLQVGDVVYVYTEFNRGGDEWTTEIVISRRPGGRIPPQSLTDWGSPSLAQEQNQAEQDWEERGIPIPQRFLSSGRAPWTNPPYPPVAPEPREVGR